MKKPPKNVWVEFGEGKGGFGAAQKRRYWDRPFPTFRPELLFGPDGDRISLTFPPGIDK
jgi:hypothetical protein